MKSPDQRDAAGLVRVLATVVLAIAGVSGFQVAASDRAYDEFKWGVYVVYWTAVPALVIAIVVTMLDYLPRTWPRTIWAGMSRPLRARAEKRDFKRWMEVWREYTALIDNLWAAKVPVSMLSDEYSEIRARLMKEQRFLRAEVAAHAKRHLQVQWGRFTDLEEKLGGRDGFLPLFRHQDWISQIVALRMESEELRHPSRTFEGLWDGLGDYALRRKWAPIGSAPRAVAIADASE